jgi:hypothetical protein
MQYRLIDLTVSSTPTRAYLLKFCLMCSRLNIEENKRAVAVRHQAAAQLKLSSFPQILSCQQSFGMSLAPRSTKDVTFRHPHETNFPFNLLHCMPYMSSEDFLKSPMWSRRYKRNRMDASKVPVYSDIQYNLIMYLQRSLGFSYNEMQYHIQTASVTTFLHSCLHSFG